MANGRRNRKFIFSLVNEEGNEEGLTLDNLESISKEIV